MRAKTVNFDRSGTPYEKLGIGHYGIKRALLSQPKAEVDTIEGDASRDWFEKGGLPDEFKEEIDYSDGDPLAFTDYIGFDEDYFIENELPEHIDSDEFLGEFKPTGSKKNSRNKNGWGTFQWQWGILPDGTKLVHYIDGLNSGFLAHKDWLK